MVSKAADKSSKVRTVTSPRTILIIISLLTFSSADSVKRCVLQADCNALLDFSKIYFLRGGLTWPSLKFWGTALVSIEILISDGSY